MDFSKMESQLRGEYREVFEKVQLYASVKEINESIVNEHIVDLYDLLFTAQAERQPVEKLLGGDVETFCAHYFEDYTRKDRIREIPARIYRIAVWILAIELIYGLLSGALFSGEFLTMKVDITAYIGGIVCGMVLNLLSDKIILPMGMKKKRPGMTRYYFAILLLFVLLIGCGIVLTRDRSIRVPVFPLLLVTGLYVAGYLIVRSLWRLRHYGTIRDMKKKELTQIVKESYNQELADKDLQLIYCRGWKKRYERMHRKKGMTPEEFYELLLKEEHKAGRLNKIMPFLYAVIVLFFVYCVATDGSTWYDTLIFAVVCGGIEAFICRALMKVEESNAKERKRILDECGQSGLDLMTFIDEKLAARGEEGGGSPR